ncbi:unnamed protein product [Dovyalis caffra]|uniref:Uncharacterized protein n=1 Tax=Dovyalis caffra TaxID=77055 RepID=A0AAV1S1T1_9ROSI|nr:unnamed protein product [Dovyalis caffra]
MAPPPDHKMGQLALDKKRFSCEGDKETNTLISPKFPTLTYWDDFMPSIITYGIRKEQSID